MLKNIKSKIITISFVLIILTVFILNIISEDKAISSTEKRLLASFPKLTQSTISSGTAMKDFEKYSTDQFIERDFFRNVKSFFNTNIYMQLDTNKLFEKDNAIYKMTYPLKEANINKSLEKINEVYNLYLQDMDVYYSIIPDKNFYLENDNHLKFDYTKLKELANNKLSNLNYIDIWDELSLDAYYKTDLHWKQENLIPVVNKIQTNMNLNKTSISDYNIINNGDFYGTYYGQISAKVEPDKLYTLTNSTIENCSTYNYETNKTSTIYGNTSTIDKYDIYLSGATPLITINNQNSSNAKELLLFRDSFGSSLAPLLIENYSKITLVDLRYIPTKSLSEYIDFKNQDVLFLYSSIILNENILR